MSAVDRGPVWQAALGAMDRYGGNAGRRLVAAAAAWQLASPVVESARRQRRSRDFTITVGGADDIYPDLHEWVLARIPDGERKAMLLDTYRPGGDEVAWKSDMRERLRVRLRYDGSRVQDVEIGGYKVKVDVSREEMPTNARENLDRHWQRYLEKVTFTCPSAAARDAVVEMIDGLAASKHEADHSSPLLMPSRWGGDWQRRTDLKPRALESVILRAGQAERLAADFRQFIAAESEYERLSQPWHRGYLFKGAPGTGKTSAARALANEFKMPVYYLPLADLERDADLMGLIGMIPARCILLLEDVDIYRAATVREEEGEQRVSLAALLNVLDGIWTPHGLVTVMTTNNADELDPALIRAGRVAVEEEFALLDLEQIDRLVEYVGGCEFDAYEFEGRSPADLMGAVHATRTMAVVR